MDTQQSDITNAPSVQEQLAASSSGADLSSQVDDSKSELNRNNMREFFAEEEQNNDASFNLAAQSVNGHDDDAQNLDGFGDDFADEASTLWQHLQAAQQDLASTRQQLEAAEQDLATALGYIEKQAAAQRRSGDIGKMQARKIQNLEAMLQAQYGGSGSGFGQQGHFGGTSGQSGGSGYGHSDASGQHPSFGQQGHRGGSSTGFNPNSASGHFGQSQNQFGVTGSNGHRGGFGFGFGSGYDQNGSSGQHGGSAQHGQRGSSGNRPVRKGMTKGKQILKDLEGVTLSNTPQHGTISINPKTRKNGTQYVFVNLNGYSGDGNQRELFGKPVFVPLSNIHGDEHSKLKKGAKVQVVVKMSEQGLEGYDLRVKA